MGGGAVEGAGYKSLRLLFERGAIGLLSDADLIDRFLERGSSGAESAFAALVERHGPMVLSVCRRALDDPHDAQDAFQATFLTLSRRAGSIRDRDSIAGWLYGVARRVSSRMRSRRARRRAVEGRAGMLRAVSEGTAAPPGPPEWEDLYAELARLPEAYRAPTVLCYLEELTNEEAAARLRLPVGTVKTRLRRARDLLRSRLADRGEVSAMGIAAALRPEPWATLAARQLSEETARMAVVGLSSLSDTAIPPAVAALCRGVLHAAFVAKCVVGAAGLLAVVIVVGALAAGGYEALPRPNDLGPVPQEPDRAAEAMPPAVGGADGAEGSPLVDPAPDPGRPGPGAGPDFGEDGGEVTSGPDGPTTPSPGVELPPRPSIEAPVLSGITVDGDLSDWPESAAMHPLEKLFHFDGRRENFDGLAVADLRDPADLRASFSVGYDPDAQLIYLAVVVRDDRLVVGNDSHMTTDAVEVYVDGLRSQAKFPREIPPGRSFWQLYDLTELPVQQYVAIPGPGPIYGTDATTNPIVMAGDLAKTRTRAASRRGEGVTTYEWAIQPFDRYPSRPTLLEPGRRIGFDVAVADEDLGASEVGPAGETQGNRLDWIYWGPQWAGMKVVDAGSLGELVLGDRPRPPRPDPSEPEAAGPTRAASIEAPPLSEIEIDGDLSDWPLTIARHPIDHIQVLPPHYGWNGLEGEDLATSPDLSAAFSVAYDPGLDLLYLAVVVRDDRLVVGNRGFWDTDAVEVYVDGRHSEDSVRLSEIDGWEEEVDASAFPALQYIGLPGPGPVYGVRRTAGRDRGPDNPILMFGDVHRTGTRMAYRRQGGQTVYEWAVKAYDRYPDWPTDLAPGRMIGLDVAVADKDAPATTGAPGTEPVADRSAWLSWSPEYNGLRYLDASHLGEVRLGDHPRAPGSPATD